MHEYIAPTETHYKNLNLVTQTHSYLTMQCKKVHAGYIYINYDLCIQHNLDTVGALKQKLTVFHSSSRQFMQQHCVAAVWYSWDGRRENQFFFFFFFFFKKATAS